MSEMKGHLLFGTILGAFLFLAGNATTFLRGDFHFCDGLAICDLHARLSFFEFAGRELLMALISIGGVASISAIDFLLGRTQRKRAV